MILILSDGDDPTANLVETKLIARGVRTLQFNAAEFPSRARVHISYDSSQPRPSGALEVNGHTYDLSTITAIWERRPDPPAPAAEVTRPMTQRFVRAESSRFIEDLWRTLSCRWLPAPTSIARGADEKVRQLKTAAALGFDLPPTLITNDPAEFVDFYRAHNGRIISKVFHSNLIRPELPEETQAWRVFTEIVSSRAPAYAASIRYAPVIFQAYVPKRSELRVTIVGRRIFAAEILSQQTHRTRFDWRRHDFRHTPYRIHTLPDSLQTQCLALLDRLNLNYGALDFILTPDGRYVFLELNVRGQWQWIEDLTGLPISSAICDFLTQQ